MECWNRSANHPILQHSSTPVHQAARTFAFWPRLPASSLRVVSRMLKSSGAMAGATLTSRVLGLVREIVYSGFMGTTWVASAFMLAFQVPNLFRRLLGEGALTAAFIPIFKQKEIKEGPAEMWRASNAVISGLIAVAGILTVLVIVGISIALAVHDFDDKTQLMLRLLRLMFPYMLLVCLAAVLIGMANARGHFFLPALSAVALNVVMIGSVLFLAPRMGLSLEEQIFGLGIGVVVAGIAQAAFQLPPLYKDGYRYRWVSPWRDPTVREVVRKMVPASIGVAAFQLNVLITQSFSFWFEPTIVSTFQYAVRLMELPQGMFGISLATYLLPTLSGLASEKKYSEFGDTLRQGLGYLVFSNLIAAAVALSLAEPIVRLIFEHGKFDAAATHRASLALAGLAPGLLMFSMVNILARAFYALGDIKTPMRISICCLALNLVFAFWLVHPYREAGLATANSLSATFNVGLLLYALRRKMSRLELSGLVRPLLILLGAAALAGGIAFWISCLWDTKFGHASLPSRIGMVFVPGAIAGLIYWTLAMAARIPAARDITDFLLQKFRRGSK
jgi:putative peptidoglycan lipid II flippase